MCLRGVQGSCEALLEVEGLRGDLQGVPSPKKAGVADHALGDLATQPLPAHHMHAVTGWGGRPESGLLTHSHDPTPQRPEATRFIQLPEIRQFCSWP